MNRTNHPHPFLALLGLSLFILGVVPCKGTIPAESDRFASFAAESTASPIRAFCVDFNWGEGGPNRFAAPGLWADASPEAHVQWFKDLGANTIQTFAVSCNGYAWYKHGAVPEQPGLVRDFLREVVRLGHAEGMQVMGYFCIGSNTRWGLENPELSYGTPNKPHIPFTDEYLEFLDQSIREAVGSTGIDGFMIDWVWQPDRKLTAGAWIEAEKTLYAELMGEAFPGEENLTEESYDTYSRLAIDRCWQVIQAAAKETNPAAIIWLSCNDPMHPHVANSLMFREVDWLMNEKGDLEILEDLREMVKPEARLLTCLAHWNKQDPATVVPTAIKRGIGVYGFSKPGESSLPPPIDHYLSMPVSNFKGDDRNIAFLARTYRAEQGKKKRDK